MSTERGPVIIRATVENMIGTVETAEIPRERWNTMSPAQRNAWIDDFGATVMNNCGGYGASIESGAPDSDLVEPLAPDLADDVAALRTKVVDFGGVIQDWRKALDAPGLLAARDDMLALLDRIEAFLGVETR